MVNLPSNLSVGDRVDREDGRFYIPIWSGSRIVCRVASDAFNEDQEDATEFAKSMVSLWNSREYRLRAPE